jgi:glutamate dehydrogenase
MAGDVFGNGMLQSPHIRLVAAFNHSTSSSIRSRTRRAPSRARAAVQNAALLWEDYSTRAISKGGGIYPRSAKSLTLSRESAGAARAAGAGDAERSHQGHSQGARRSVVERRHRHLRQGHSESNSDVGDRSNDAVRIDARELNCKVIGEGGNLGLSQLGRIEFARRGGRLNTDFIDNSAGVNCSDVEVNLKILLNGAVRAKEITRAGRDRLLVQMTSEVAALVLRNNYLQGQAISTSEFQSKERLSESAYVIRAFERSGDLNRSLEFLPSDEEIAERRKAGEGLTRPELAITLSYGKIWLYRALIHSDVPEDPYLSTELARYFPRR